MIDLTDCLFVMYVALRVALRWMKRRLGRPDDGTSKRSPLHAFCNRNVRWCALPPSLTLTVRAVDEANEWHRFEGVRSIHDFLDPTTGSVAENLRCFFDVPHDNGAFHHGHRFQTPSDRGGVSPSAGGPCIGIQQHARVSVPRTEAMWVVCAPNRDGEALRVLASIMAWVAMGHPMCVYTGEPLYPNVYQQFQDQLRFPEKASPLDLIHLVTRHMDEPSMTQCVVHSLRCMGQCGCSITGLQSNIGDKFLGIEECGDTHRAASDELLLLSRRPGLVRRCYSVPWSSGYIHTATELLQAMQHAWK